VGEVVLSVKPHDGRSYGARDIWLLQLNQSGVYSTLRTAIISGDLGQNGPTHVGAIGDGVNDPSDPRHVSGLDLINDMVVASVAQ
jgi:hypothetical protein